MYSNKIKNKYLLIQEWYVSVTLFIFCEPKIYFHYNYILKTFCKYKMWVKIAKIIKGVTFWIEHIAEEKYLF